MESTRSSFESSLHGRGIGKRWTSTRIRYSGSTHFSPPTWSIHNPDASCESHETPDFADYWAQFESIYETALRAAFGGPIEWAGLKGGAMGYQPEILVAASTAGYELEVSPAEAVALMVILQAYAFSAKHGTISRLLRPSLRARATTTACLRRFLPQ